MMKIITIIIIIKYANNVERIISIMDSWGSVPLPIEVMNISQKCVTLDYLIDMRVSHY